MEMDVAVLEAAVAAVRKRVAETYSAAGAWIVGSSGYMHIPLGPQHVSESRQRGCWS